MKKKYRAVSLLVLVFLLQTACSLAPSPRFEGPPPQTCRPEGPPFSRSCSSGFYYYFHDNQIKRVMDAKTAVSKFPWRHIGSLNGSGTGILVGERYVLASAHSIYFEEGQRRDSLWFALAAVGQQCQPFGRVPIDKAWVPRQWIDKLGSLGSASRETRAFDWTLLRLKYEPRSIDATLSPEPSGNFIRLTDDFIRKGSIRSAGYGCGEDRPFSIKRPHLTPSWTNDEGTFAKRYVLGNAAVDRASLIGADVETTAGMSGGPVWWEHRSGVPVLIGIMIGSTQAACDNGENWVTEIGGTAWAKIHKIMSQDQNPLIDTVDLTLTGMVELPMEDSEESPPRCPILENR